MPTHVTVTKHNDPIDRCIYCAHDAARGALDAGLGVTDVNFDRLPPADFLVGAYPNSVDAVCDDHLARAVKRHFYVMENFT